MPQYKCKNGNIKSRSKITLNVEYDAIKCDCLQDIPIFICVINVCECIYIQGDDFVYIIYK